MAKKLSYQVEELIPGPLILEEDAGEGLSTGDFKVNGDIIVEVGGSDKGFGQIKDAQNGYVAADDIDSATFRKIPLWAFGFLY